jgi:hypothetical protein
MDELLLDIDEWNRRLWRLYHSAGAAGIALVMVVVRGEP